MKIRRLVSLVIAFAFIAMSTTGAFASSAPKVTFKTSKIKSGYVTKFYVKNHYYNTKVKTSKKLKVKIVNESKVTRKMLTHRKDRYILVVKVKGHCIDNNGNGRTSTGCYINYQDCENAVKGQKYITYCIYGNNNYIDDVVNRIDTWN